MTKGDYSSYDGESISKHRQHEFEYCQHDVSSLSSSLRLDDYILIKSVVTSDDLSFDLSQSCMDQQQRHSLDDVNRTCTISYSGEVEKDRTCLLSQHDPNERIRAVYPGQDCSPPNVIDWINKMTHRFYTVPNDGSYSSLQSKAIQQALSEALLNPYVTTTGAVCDRVDIKSITPHDFLLKYVLPQRPAILYGVHDLSSQVYHIPRLHIIYTTPHNIHM